MKTGFWDRVLVYLYVLITLIIVAATALLSIGIDIIDMLIEGLSSNMPGLFWRLIVAGLGVLIILLGVYVSVVITPSRKRKNNFITISSDNGGQVRVSLPAIREMAGQAIKNVKGLEDISISIVEASDAIEVNVAMDVESGVHVPTVTMNMQRAIKTNIERNCGINVRSVTVDVKNVLTSADSAAYEEVEVVPVVSADASPANEEEVIIAEDALIVQEEDIITEADDVASEETTEETEISEEDSEENKESAPEETE